MTITKSLQLIIMSQMIHIIINTVTLSHQQQPSKSTSRTKVSKTSRETIYRFTELLHSKITNNNSSI